MEQPWNFRQILKFSPERDYKCQGTTLKGQQCRNPAKNVSEAGRILDKMDTLKRLSDSNNHLESLAYVSLCQHYHNGLGKRGPGYSQVDRVVEKWEYSIQLYATELNTKRKHARETVTAKKDVNTRARRVDASMEAARYREVQKKLEAQRELEAERELEEERKLEAERKRGVQRKLDAQRKLEAEQKLKEEEELEACRILELRRKHQVDEKQKTETIINKMPHDPFADSGSDARPNLFTTPENQSSQFHTDTSPENLCLPSPPTTPPLQRSLPIAEGYSFQFSAPSPTNNSGPKNYMATRRLPKATSEAETRTSHQDSESVPRWTPPSTAFTFQPPDQNVVSVTETVVEKHKCTDPVAANSETAFAFSFGVEHSNTPTFEFEMPQPSHDQETRHTTEIILNSIESDTPEIQKPTLSLVSPPETPSHERETTYGYASISSNSTRYRTYLPATQKYGLMTPGETPESADRLLKTYMPSDMDADFFTTPSRQPRESRMPSSVPPRKPLPIGRDTSESTAGASSVSLANEAVSSSAEKLASAAVLEVEGDERQRTGCLRGLGWRSVRNWVGRKSDSLKTQTRGALQRKSARDISGTGKL